LTEASRALDAFFETYDVLLSPVARHPPKLLGEHATDLPFDILFERAVDNSDFTPVINAAGAPAMSVPLNRNANGLPVGSHLVARAGAEATLFGLAYQLEAARPWADRWAPPSYPAVAPHVAHGRARPSTPGASCSTICKAGTGPEAAVSP